MYAGEPAGDHIELRGAPGCRVRLVGPKGGRYGPSDATMFSRPDCRSPLASSNKRAKKAIKAEESGDLAEAARLWKIYGPEFPPMD